MMEMSLCLCAGLNELLQLGRVHPAVLTAQLTLLCSWEFGCLWYFVLPFFPGKPMARAGVGGCVREGQLAAQRLSGEDLAGATSAHCCLESSILPAGAATAGASSGPPDSFQTCF